MYALDLNMSSSCESLKALLAGFRSADSDLVALAPLPPSITEARAGAFGSDAVVGAETDVGNLLAVTLLPSAGGMTSGSRPALCVKEAGRCVGSRGIGTCHG
mmetsp:Transcript_6359/g.14610  ORF Transcript_6359/g.14610 Transcript_6359/m.14610 type:complete len:102 (+) Transcript_6359:1053-1358(+)